MPASTKRSVSRRMVSPARMAALRSSSRRVFNPDATAALLALAPLGFLAFAAGGGSLVELAAAGLREDPCLLDLLVEAAECGLERLAPAAPPPRQIPVSPALSAPNISPPPSPPTCASSPPR